MSRILSLIFEEETQNKGTRQILKIIIKEKFSLIKNNMKSHIFKKKPYCVAENVDPELSTPRHISSNQNQK